MKEPSIYYKAKSVSYWFVATCFLALFFYALTASVFRALLMTVLFYLFVYTLNRSKENSDIVKSMEVNRSMMDKGFKK